MTPILVLDHGFVRLVSYTQPPPSHIEIALDFDGPLEEIAYYSARWNGDLELARATRNNPDAMWRYPDPKDPKAPHDEKLLRKMRGEGHTSPFEFMDFTFQVKAPIFVLRQWHRHRTQSYQEVSARYTELPEDFYIPAPEHVGTQAKTNKQGRTEEENVFAQVFLDRLKAKAIDAFQEYRLALSNRVPRELARLFLPLNTYSLMYAKANLSNWFRFLELRLDLHAQYEVRVYAEAILTLLKSVCPIAVDAFCQDLYETDPQKWEHLK